MLAKWNPFNGGIARSSSPMPAFDELFREADNLLRSSFFGDLAFPRVGWSAATTYLPAADVLETENEIQVKVDLPGHDPKSLQVRLEGDTLTIQSERKQESRSERDGYLRAERSHGTFARSFVLPNTVDSGKCEARFENGVLTVTLPKREEARPRTINIKVQS
jgi:HSP20 family protein